MHPAEVQEGASCRQAWGWPQKALWLTCLWLQSLVGPGAEMCCQALPAGKPGLTPGREDVLAMQKGGPAPRAWGGGPPQGAPGGSWGVGRNVTCGLTMDMLWDLAGVRILCLEIA